MAKKRTTIEINGRLYDAATGKIVSNSPTASKLIDGFQAPIQRSNSQNRNPNQASSIHHKPQRTKKLHPAAAKTAQPIPKTVIAKSAPVTSNEVITAPTSKVSLRANASAERSQRAQTHTKSESVNKFHKIQATPTQPAVTPQQTNTVAVPSVMPKPAQAKPAAVSPAQVIEATEQKAGPSDPEDNKKTTRRPRLATAALAVIAILAIGGFYTYQNIPNLALRIASSRAGVEASLPGYKPSGYTFSGPVSYSEGIIELEFASNSDDRTYSITQKESSWDSQSLLDNYVKSTAEDYLTFQEGGLTVYVYDESNATWVDGGVWYKIEGNTLLTSEQLLKIASSL